MSAYTSYYGNPVLKTLINPIFVQISASKPRAFEVDGVFKLILPSYKELVEQHKQSKISDTYYRAKYMQQLELNKEKILAKYEELLKVSGTQPVVFLCWCGPSKFCHRHIFAEWINEHSENKIYEL